MSFEEFTQKTVIKIEQRKEIDRRMRCLLIQDEAPKIKVWLNGYTSKSTPKGRRI